MPPIFCNFQLITYFCMINQTNKFIKPITITLFRDDFLSTGSETNIRTNKDQLSSTSV